MPRKTKKQLLAERAEQAKAEAQKRTAEYEFYSQTRWDNWIEQIKESHISFDENSEEGNEGAAIIVNMSDDVILACLKIVARFDKEAITQEKALEVFNKIRDIVLAPVESISEEADFMIYSMQDSLNCSLASFENYFCHEYDEKANFKKLLDEAFKAEEAANNAKTDEEAGDCFEQAFDIVASMGAAIISGQTLDDELIAGIPEEKQGTAVASWLDGIDSITAAMVGSDSYKNFDEEDDGSD